MNPVDDVLGRFNFRKIRKVMRVTGHRWNQQLGSGTIRFLPDEVLLRETARKLLEEVLRTGRLAAAGGFTAFRHGNTLGLRFDVETAVAAVPP